MIGNDGNTYEGRGFDFTGEIVTKEASIEVGLVLAFIGIFDDHPPSARQISMYNAFLEKSSSRGLLAKNLTVVTEGQITNSGRGSGILEVVGGSDNFYSRKYLLSTNNSCCG